MKVARNAARTWHTITPRKRTQRVVAAAPSSKRPTGGVKLSFLSRLDHNRTAGETPIIRPSAPPPDPPPSTAAVTATTASQAMGTYKYHHEDDCVTCEMLTEGTTFQSTMTGKQYKFVPAVSCNDRSVIYLVSQALYSRIFFERKWCL